MTAPEAEPEVRWWHRLGRGQRAALAVLVGIVALNAVATAGNSYLGNDPGGPVSSAFSTGSDGLRGWSDLLERRGHDVERRKTALADRRPSSDETVVLADPESLSSADAAAMVRFLRSGGRLVVAGADTVDLLEAFGLGDLDVVTPGLERVTRPWVPVAEMDGIERIEGARTTWARLGSILPVAGSDGDPVVGVTTIGAGRLIAVSDASVFDNVHLDEADNAAFALQVVGESGRGVVFVESVHGFGRTGWAAVPSSWKWGLLLLAVAVAIGLWSVGTRFGPPEPQERRLRPARREHVDAVAADLAQVVQTDQEAVDPLVTATRRSVGARIGAPPEASPAVLYATGEAVGADLGHLAVITHPVEDPVHALQVGAVAAAEQRSRHGLPPADTVAAEPSPGGTDP